MSSNAVETQPSCRTPVTASAKTQKIQRDGLSARLFVPWGCHYVTSCVEELESGQREPELYQWVSGLTKSGVLFDVVTSYGQEAALASSLQDRAVTVVGFDCCLLHAHFCAMNKRLNNYRSKFVFATVGETSDMPVPITCNSGTHLPHLHCKNTRYSYEASSLALDDYASSRGLFPTNLKIDVDGAEFSVLKGAEKILGNETLTDIFIEIDHENDGIFGLLEARDISVSWMHDKPQNADVLFTR